tara:strand:- start:3 stop:329 length:327 start_codon:yes stop_codon:yes gene_type:complete
MQSNLKYVSFLNSQLNLGKKNLLYSEMEILTTLKKLKVFTKLRKQEFAAKNLLKKTISQLRKELQNLENFLPLQELGKESIDLSSSPKNRDSLEAEIDNLKNKISELQ